MNNHLTRISLVLPCFNAEKYICDCLDSIRSQNYENLQLIVVDGSSDDSTLKQIDKYSDIVDLLISEPDEGQSDAILKGFKQVDGEIWGWINADDQFRSEALNTAADYWVQSNKPGFIYGIANKIDENGITIKEGKYHPFSKKRLKDIFFMTQPACFFNTEITRKLGGPHKNLDYAMDWEFVLRLSRDSETVSIPKILADLRIHNNTKTSLGGYKRSLEIAQIGRQYGGIFNKNYVSFKVLEFFYSLEKKSSFNVYRKLRRFSSRVFDQMWGHTNYMIHDHTFS